MGKLWEGRLCGELDERVDSFNSSIGIDSRMYRQDIEGSIAHARMLGNKGIIPEADALLIIEGLKGILADIESGSLQIDMASEDIHTFIEQVLTKRIGEAGKKLHTARSRNDQVALDLRMYLRDEAKELTSLIRDLMEVLVSKAGEHKATIMPGYTHLQRAQPVSFGHHLIAYAMMFMRDIGRLEDASGRMNLSPLGSCALAGTTYGIDRQATALELGFTDVVENSMDAVSDRDFCIELASSLSIAMMHLSRLCEEIVLWSSMEFGFIELDSRFTTGSSIMPQKKNPDVAELVRGKTGRVYGNLMALLTIMKGLPLAYNKDMQEDKEAIMDSFDTAKACFSVISPMLFSIEVHKDRMTEAALKGFINSTDLADYLVRKGVPFRAAYGIVGRIVAKCIDEGKVLEDLPMEDYLQFSGLFEKDLYEAVDLDGCMRKRISEGGTSARSVEKQIDFIKAFLSESGSNNTEP